MDVIHEIIGRAVQKIIGWAQTDRYRVPELVVFHLLGIRQPSVTAMEIRRAHEAVRDFYFWVSHEPRKNEDILRALANLMALMPPLEMCLEALGAQPSTAYADNLASAVRQLVELNDRLTGAKNE